MNIKDPYIQGQGAVVTAEAGQEAAAGPPVRANTSPTFPARAGEAGQGLDGIETVTTQDNIES